MPWSKPAPGYEPVSNHEGMPGPSFDLKPDGLRCQWVQRGGYPQCRLLLGHEGAHEFISHPPTGSTTGVIGSAQPPSNPEQPEAAE